MARFETRIIGRSGPKTVFIEADNAKDAEKIPSR